MTLGNTAILLHEQDNVATALVDLAQGDQVQTALGDLVYTVALLEDIALAHKFALRDIREGEEVLKYGMPIGRALCDIRAGEWVHVHNCRSHRWGFNNEKYGLQA
jgi:altronate dehydratase